MKILLTAINAKYIHSNLAVYSLKANVGTYKEQVEIGEFTINNPWDYVLEEIYKRKPDVLCFSCYIWNLSMVEEVMREFHKLCPSVPIWLGGPEVSFEAETFLKSHPEVTGIMMGEGEAVFQDLCRYYIEGNISFEEIKGIAYRQEGKISVNPWRDILDMSKLSFAYDTMEDFSHRIIYYESSRGCPFSCSYCLSSVDKKLRFRDVELVKKELQFFMDQKVPLIKFVDRTFNCNHNHAMAIWQYILDNDNGVTNFHFEISADLLREEELELMSRMRPGLIQLEIGVQSTNEATIHEIKRTMRLEQLKYIVKKIQSFGNIHEHLDLIAGLPYEDYKTFQKSFDEIYALQPNELQMGFLKVLRGSYMYDHAKEYGVLYHDNPPYEVLATKWLSYEEILAMKRVEEMLEVYYNSGQFEITMQVLKGLYNSSFAMYQGLGDFYESKGYFGMNHSRIKRCEILLEYIKEEIQKGVLSKEVYPCIQESVLFDLYYRENCKSRPAWACDMAEFKKVTHFYCSRGKLGHVEPFHYDFLGKLEAVPNLKKEPYWVKFDYENRDPLTHQAKAVYVNPEEDMPKEESEKLWQQKEL